MTYPPTPTRVPKSQERALRQDRAHIIGTWQIKLTVVEVALMTLEIVCANDKALAARLAKIRRWLEECWVSIGQGSGKKLSAEVQRRADRESALVDDALRSVVGDCTTPEAWAARLVAIDAMIGDVVASMVKGRPRCWGYLGQTLGTLARRFLRGSADPGQAEADGWEIYERTEEKTRWANG
ncbi:hypothetical protein [Solidesulfovibrio sp.]